MTFRAYLVELVGTFLLVFFSAGIVLVAHQGLAESNGRLPYERLLGVAVIQGSVFAIILNFSTRMTQGCLNPAVTLALWVTKRFDFGRCFALILMQLIGAALGGGVAIFLFLEADPQAVERCYAATPHLAAFYKVAPIDTGSWLGGSTAEAVLTFLVTLALLTSVLDPKLAEWRWAPLLAGLALTAAVLVGYNLTGAALNPARWFGTAAWQHLPDSLPGNQDSLWRDHLPYWMGPIVGALLAAVVYAEWLRPQGDKNG